MGRLLNFFTQYYLTFLRRASAKSAAATAAFAAEGEHSGYTVSATEYHCMNGHTGTVNSVELVSKQVISAQRVGFVIKVNVTCPVCNETGDYKSGITYFTNQATGCHEPFNSKRRVDYWKAGVLDYTSDYIEFSITGPIISTTHHEKVDPTCIEAGTEEYWQCDVCQKYFSDKNAENEIDAPEVIDATGHALISHQKVEPTCTQAGTQEYWECESCGLLFSDKECTEQIDAPVKIKALGHDLGGWTQSENGHVKKCKRCDYVTQEEPHVLKTVVDKAATATEKGAQHTECTLCDYKGASEEIAATGTPASNNGASNNSNTASNTQKTAVKTGVESNIMLYAVIIAAAAAALAVVLLKKRKIK